MMNRKHILLGLVAIATGGLLLSDPAAAQTASRNTRPSLVERIDQFGENLVGGIFSRKPKEDKSVAPPWGDPSDADDSASRAGSAIRPRGSAQGKTPTSSTSGARTTTMSAAVAQRTPAVATSARPRANSTLPESVSVFSGYGAGPSLPAANALRPDATSSDPDRRMVVSPPGSNYVGIPSGVSVDPTPTRSEQRTAMRTPPTVLPTGGLIVQNPTVSAEPTVAKVEPSTATASSDVPGQPALHERLERFRESVFGETATAQAATAEKTAMAAAPSQPIAPPATDKVAVSLPGAAPTSEAAKPAETKVEAQRTPTLAPPRSTDAAAALLARRTQNTVVETPPVETPPVQTPPIQTPTLPPAETATAGSASVASDAPAEGPDRLLLTRRSPILDVKTVGPSRIAVGKRSEYIVAMENLGDVAAEDVVVTIALPSWAEVASAEGTSGAILAEESPGGARRLVWKVGPVEAHSRQKATLGIVPRQSRPIDLAVRWDFRPIATQAVIEVEEPRLSMRLDGPREVRFGESEVFKLEIANTGNGAADDVVLTLMPLVPGEGGPTRHRLGTLPAGQQKTIEMELTARQSGSLAVEMLVECDGSAKATLSESLLVRKPEVQLAIDAPKMHFTGAVATYRIRVKNTGNLAAENVQLAVKIPPEAKLVSASPTATPSADGQSVEWRLERLTEGAEQELLLTCSLEHEGYSQFKAQASGKQISAEATAVTRVESVADLVLKVSDPSGPVPLGEETVYTIRIRNRGTKDATDVEAVIYFSEGVEPVSAEGGRYTIRPGQVTFDPIGVVPANKDVVLKIVAKAATPGNHMFRAEVHCRPLGTKLVGEETTHFYQGDQLNVPESQPMLGATPAAVREPSLSADRRAVDGNQNPPR